jgi:hypothetical protein
MLLSVVWHAVSFASLFLRNVCILNQIDQEFTTMHPFQCYTKLILIMRSKTPPHIVSFKIHTFSLSKASPSLKHTSDRSISEYCLGTIKTVD